MARFGLQAKTGGRLKKEVSLDMIVTVPPVEASTRLEEPSSSKVELERENALAKGRMVNNSQNEYTNDANPKKTSSEDDQRSQNRETKTAPTKKTRHGVQIDERNSHDVDENKSESESLWKFPVDESQGQPAPVAAPLSRRFARGSDGGNGEDEREIGQKPVGDLKQQGRNVWFDGDEDEVGEDDKDNTDEDDDEDGDDDDDEYANEYDSASDSTWSGNSHFTEIQRIDLEKQAQGDWAYRHGHLYYLGSIWDLRSRRHECTLCERLWHQTRLDPAIKNAYLTKSRCILKLMELRGRRTDGSDSEVYMLNLVYIYGY